MAQISQNKLTPLLVLIAAVVVGVILYKQGKSDALPAGAPMEQVPEAGLPETERGADADTPDETLRTVVGETRALSAQLRELREENKRLRANSGRVAMDTMRAELRNELRGEIRAELRAKLDAAGHGTQASPAPSSSPSDSGPLGRVLGGAPRELVGALPSGFGFERGGAAGSVAAAPAAVSVNTGRMVLPAGYRLAKGADGKKAIVRDAPVAAQGVFPAPPPGAQPVAAKAIVKPFYTIPENATLLGATAMTALIGRVPVDGQVTDPMQFKLLLGPENLAANGHVLPSNLAGVVVSGVAIGDMALSCTEGLIQSLTFVFNDGSIHTVSRRSNGTTPTFGGGGAGAASGGKRSLAEAPKLGYVSDRYGNPCIPGRFVTNAPAYLTDIVGLRTLSLAGKAAAASQTTQSTNAFGGVNSSMTGNRGTFILGEALSGGVDEVTSWIMSRLNNSFDAVVVAAGAEVAVHIDTEIPIDKSSQARRIDYGRIDAGRTHTASTRGHWYGMD